jgi:hypothetical protein
MVEAFGGKVTGAVSGRTHILVVGKEPGMGKVSQAEGQPNCQLMVSNTRLALNITRFISCYFCSISRIFEMRCKMDATFLPREQHL